MRIAHVKVMCTYIYIYIQHHPSNIVTVMLHPTPAPHKPQSQRTQSYLSSVCFFLWFAVMVCCYGLLLWFAVILSKTSRCQRLTKNSAPPNQSTTNQCNRAFQFTESFPSCSQRCNVNMSRFERLCPLSSWGCLNIYTSHHKPYNEGIYMQVEKYAATWL